RPPRGLAQEALPRAARDHRAVAGLRPGGPGLRRPRPARLPLPRAVVALPRPLDPAQDRARGHLAPRGVLERSARSPGTGRVGWGAARRKRRIVGARDENPPISGENSPPPA